MRMNKRNFDSEAVKWDLNPGRVKVAADIARAIIGEITLSKDMDVLDFGCGTGLLTFALQPFVRSVTGVDSSQGMIDVFRRKIAGSGVQNVQARYLDPEDDPPLSGSYHLIVSSMTLHHIQAVDALIRQFYRILHPSGMLCIADLDSDGGRFHESNDGVFHFGFDRAEITDQFRNA